MRKGAKTILLLAGAFIIVALVAVVFVPALVDVQRYRPLIEKKLTEATGRPVELEGEMRLSLFPWVGASVQDLRVGSLEGFGEKDLLRAKSFKAHVKVMPLLSGDVQVDSIVLDKPEIYLEKRKDGEVNWKGPKSAAVGTGAPAPDREAVPQPAEVTPQPAEDRGFRLQSLAIGELLLKDGRVQYIDAVKGSRTVISDCTVKVRDISLDRPLKVEIAAVADGRPVAMSGEVGPVGRRPGQGSLPLDLVLMIADQLKAHVKGTIEDPAGALSYDLSVDIERFSPKELLQALEMPFEIADPGALTAVELSVRAAGDAKSARLTDGRLLLDDSTLIFHGELTSFAPPGLVFAGKLDSIDLDRYLPAPTTSDGVATPEGRPSTGEASSAGNASEQQAGAGSRQQPMVNAEQRASGQIDYGPLRELGLKTDVAVGELRVKGGSVTDLQLHLRADKGIWTVSPLTMKLYGGDLASTAVVDVQGKKPEAAVEVKTTALQVGPLLQDFLQKDVLEGVLNSDVSLKFQGDTLPAVKRTLSGRGEALLRDGAIIGIDLAGMVRNVQASFALAEQPAEKPRTDFAELRVPFTLTDGLLNTEDATLSSPFLRANASGRVNLVSENLDLKVKPKFVASLKGQGDTMDRSGIMVPVLVRGTFASPRFSPDLTGLVQQQMQEGGALRKALEKEIPPEKAESIEKEINKLIPKLFK